MLISMVPLIVLFEGSLLMARAFGNTPVAAEAPPPREPTPEQPG
jgi:Sec-independent protein secretion pathway component TatC